MMSIVVMRKKIKSAVDQHTPRQDRQSLGLQQIIPDSQHNQDQRDSVENIKEVLPRLHKVSRTPDLPLRCVKNKGLHCEEDEYRHVWQHRANEGVGVEERFVLP